MKRLTLAFASFFLLSFLFSQPANAAIRYVDGYERSDGTYVSGHYRDTSNDGNQYNNANYLGYNSDYNGSRRVEGYFGRDNQ